VKPAALRRFCLGLAGASEEFPFGAGVSVFKAGGKMFALSSLGASPLRVSVKCEPEISEQLRGTYVEIEPGYHLNKRHWITIDLTGSLEDAMVRELIENSFDLVAG
jgi:predicted DNA-binding protein (MmcQ/YjbR family)